MKTVKNLRAPKTSQRHHIAGISAVLSLATAGVGCDKPLPRPEPTVRSTKVVTLPAAPELTVKPYTSKHADGALTVEGALRERESHMGATVTVRGVVAELVQCAPIPQELPPDAPPDAPVPPPIVPDNCTPPQHLVLMDKAANPKWKLTAYGTMSSQLGKVALQEEVTLTGVLDMVSPDGVFLRQSGLLLLPDLPKPEPEPVPTEPAPTEPAPTP